MLRHLFQGCSIRSVYKILNHLELFIFALFIYFFLKKGKKNRIYTLSTDRANVLCAGAMTAALQHFMHIFFYVSFFFTVMLLKRVKSAIWKGNLLFVDQIAL